MKQFYLIAALLVSISSFAQKKGTGKPAVDTSFYDYDEIFSELDNLLDSMNTPRSFAVANFGVGNGFFNYQARMNDTAKALNKLVFSPSLSYFHRTGFGVSAETDVINDGEKLNFYQFSLTGSYDYLKNRNFITGVSFSRYFPKQDLPFYTSPLLADAMLYITYRKHNLRPSVNLQYGWGSQKSYTEQKEKIRNIRTTRTITTVNKVADFTMTTSLRYHFYWLNQLSKKDYLRFTPQISLVSGSQQFGFNQLMNTTSSKNSSGKNTTFSKENLVLNDNLAFRPLSVTTFLRTEYAKGNFFIQPQVAFDYYFPATTDPFTVSFMLNAGITIQ